MRIGQRVKWAYGGTTTYGKIVSKKGAGLFSVKGPSGGIVKRRGTEANPVYLIKSESTGGSVLKTLSDLKPAPKAK